MGRTVNPASTAAALTTEDLAKQGLEFAAFVGQIMAGNGDACALPDGRNPGRGHRRSFLRCTHKRFYAIGWLETVETIQAVVVAAHIGANGQGTNGHGFQRWQIESLNPRRQAHYRSSPRQHLKKPFSTEPLHQ